MLEAFARHFGRVSEASARAPGRINLLGEHTDYNDGYVLPTAIGLFAEVTLAVRDDDRVIVLSEARGQRQSYRLGAEQRSGGWIDYFSGVTRALAESGHAHRGFDAMVRSSVPIGRGLSSSAALEVALLRALRTRFGLELDDVALAKIAHRAETVHVGVPVGLLDQMASSLADPKAALFLDMRSLEMERIPLPDDLEIAVIDSGIVHDHATGGYRTRRAECEQAAALLGLVSLRDASLAGASTLPEPLASRARHVLTENERVLAGVQCLRDGDLAGLGALFFASHASLRDDYRVSVPEVDAIVERARQIPAALGARMTGGGFGGAVIVCVQRGEAERVARMLASDPAHILVPGVSA